MKNKQEKVGIIIDANEKKKAEKVFKSLGLDFQTAISIFIHRCIGAKKIPFEYEIPNKETLEALKEMDEILSDPNHKAFDTAEEAIEYLHKSSK